MARQQMYKELERLYQQVDWSDRESIHRYNEKAREYRKMVEEEEEEKNEAGMVCCSCSEV